MYVFIFKKKKKMTKIIKIKKKKSIYPLVFYTISKDLKKI